MEQMLNFGMVYGVMNWWSSIEVGLCGLVMSYMCQGSLSSGSYAILLKWLGVKSLYQNHAWLEVRAFIVLVGFNYSTPTYQKKLLYSNEGTWGVMEEKMVKMKDILES